jgi:hypothetical protein
MYKILVQCALQSLVPSTSLPPVVAADEALLKGFLWMTSLEFTSSAVYDGTFMSV